MEYHFFFCWIPKRVLPRSILGAIIYHGPFCLHAPVSAFPPYEELFITFMEQHYLCWIVDPGLWVNYLCVISCLRFMFLFASYTHPFPSSPSYYCYLLLLFSCSVVSDSLQPHGLQDAELPCSSPSPGVCSNSCPLSQWCHPTISSSVAPFSSCLQSFPASESFPMTRLCASSGQSIGASASASVFQVNIQGWFPLGLTGLISSLSKDSQEFYPSPQFESINSLVFSLLYGPNLTSVPEYWKQNMALSIRTFVGKVISLLFNILSRFVIAFLPRNKHLLISCLQSPSAVIWEPEKIKSVIVSIFLPHLFSMKLWDWMPWS